MSDSDSKPRSSRLIIDPNTLSPFRGASTAIDRRQWGGSMGLWTFDGDRNVFASLGYKNEIEPSDYTRRYRRGDIAKRLVGGLSKETWRSGISVMEDPDPTTDTKFEQAVKSLVDRLGLWPIFLRADILTGLGEFGLILIGADGLPETELPAMRGPDDVLYLKPVSQAYATIEKFDEDRASPRYGLPTLYRVAGRFGKKTVSQKLHYTRVLHIVEDPLDTEYLGTPRLEDVWNRLDDLDKVVGAGAEAFWRLALPWLQVDLPPDAAMTPTQETALNDEIEEMVHDLRRVARTRGAKINTIDTDVAAIKASSEPIIELIAATKGLPKRWLMGTERGELASSQDRQALNERVGDRRSQFAEPHLRTFIDRLIKYRALPAPRNPYSILWPEIEELSEDEKATLASSISSANKAQSDAAGTPIMTGDEIRDKVWNLPPIEEVDTGRAMRGLESFDTTDNPPDEPDWKAVHRVADEHLVPTATIVAKMILEMGENLDVGVVERALESHALIDAQAEAYSAIDDAIADNLGDLTDELYATLVDGAEAVAQVARRRGSYFMTAQKGLLRKARDWVRGAADAKLTYGFDKTNPEAKKWASRYAHENVVEIDRASKAAINALISRSFSGGFQPRKAASAIRDQIGLHRQYVTAVSNLRKELEAAKGGELITRFQPRPGVRELPGFRARVPRGGASKAWIDRRVGQYETMLKNHRGWNVARTSIIDASCEGQIQLWRQGIASGEIPSGIEKEWIATPDDRSCNECIELAGEQVPINEEFSGGIDRPTLHASCRCGIGLVTPGSGKAQTPDGIRKQIEELA